ncbi:hypothetical protein QOZ80_4AG0326560 [Eleusine coracana subsp. coracana]|nr:hypothetical protein QOZ80_4AG0326560 [Eleusine coracana subsp. coracana]
MDSDQGIDPSAGDGGDWRAHLQSGLRDRIVNRIMEGLHKHLTLSAAEALSDELKKIAVQFEEKIYAAATSQSDYLQKITLKMLSLESRQTNTQQNSQNAQVIQNQRLCSPGAGNWQEELYQEIKTMKNKYLPELSDLCNKISMKLQQIDNHMPSQKLTDQYEKMKNFKLLVERTLQFLQIDKGCVQLALKDKIPVYERQIVHILNSQKRKPVQTLEQSAGQTSNCNTSRIHVDSAAGTGCPGAGDLHELNHINKTLKNQYVAGLSDLYQISTKLRTDSHMASQKPTDQYEEMKSFKVMLERSSQSLQIGKGSVQPAPEQSIPMYKRQIISILNSEDWKPE